MRQEYQNLRSELTNLIEKLNQKYPPSIEELEGLYMTGKYILDAGGNSEEIFVWLLQEFKSKLFGIIPYTRRGKKEIALIKFLPGENTIDVEIPYYLEDEWAINEFERIESENILSRLFKFRRRVKVPQGARHVDEFLREWSKKNGYNYRRCSCKLC
jgi:hypothetical protein